MEFVGAESVGTGGVLEEEAGEVGNHGALRSRQLLAKRDNFHGFGAHDLNLWLISHEGQGKFSNNLLEN